MDYRRNTCIYGTDYYGTYSMRHICSTWISVVIAADSESAELLSSIGTVGFCHHVMLLSITRYDRFGAIIGACENSI